MRRVFARLLPIPAVILLGSTAWAGPYKDTIALFKHAGESASFFSESYGYAVFPRIGEGAVVIGGAHGEGRVFEHGRYVGDASLSQVSVGAQLGGQAYSEIVFFKDRDAFERFTRGNFALNANASVVAVTAAASATAGPVGTSAGASDTQDDATTSGGYHDGFAVFVIAKGGAMFQASVGGENISFTPRALKETQTASADGSDH